MTSDYVDEGSRNAPACTLSTASSAEVSPPSVDQCGDTVAPILPYDALPTPAHIVREDKDRRSLWWRYPSAGKIQKASFAFRSSSVKTMGYPTINNSYAYHLIDVGYDIDSGSIKDDCRWVEALM